VICAGQLDCNVECKSFHIFPGGKLNGDIMANHVIVAGLMIGNAKAERVQMGAACRF
jgi:cytoskeletal protein CcmA (bactofilin family)